MDLSRASLIFDGYLKEKSTQEIFCALADIDHESRVWVYAELMNRLDYQRIQNLNTFGSVDNKKSISGN
mgnify:CR=1 FL=1